MTLFQGLFTGRNRSKEQARQACSFLKDSSIPIVFLLVLLTLHEVGRTKNYQNYHSNRCNNVNCVTFHITQILSKDTNFLD